MMKRWVVCTISVATYCMLILFCICYQMYVVHGQIIGPGDEGKKCNAGERVADSGSMCVGCFPGKYMGQNAHTCKRLSGCSSIER